jgi:hypothetical protein
MADPESSAHSEATNAVEPAVRRAGQMVLGAARVAAEAASHRGDRVRMEYAQGLTADVQKRVAHAPDHMGEIGVGGELVPASIMGENSRSLELADTVRDPSYITVDASRDRLDLAHGAGARRRRNHQCLKQP